jgi:ABC-type transporter Mla subunit MlaD
MRGRGTSAITASPTMVGAVTTLIVIVAVFLAYNANAGLPFVPVYRVSVEIPDAARLTNNNEVRIGGHRVGVVESIEVVQDSGSTATAQASGDPASASATGGTVARLNLKLDKDAEPLPKDSVFRIRYRSSFGLKYLEIVRGTGDAAPEGYTFNGLDDATDRATSCFLPDDPRYAKEESAQTGCFQPQI